MNNKLIYLICIVLMASSCSNNDGNLKDQLYQNTTFNNYHINLSSLETRRESIVSTNISEDTFAYKTIVTADIGVRVESDLATIKSKKSVINNVVVESYFPGLPESSEPREIRNKIFKVIFDNDIFTNTDYYYTNGVIIDLVTPLAATNPVNKIFPGRKRSDISLSGFSIRQNIYTPIDPDVEEIRYGDRPFAGLLTIGQFNTNTNFNKKLNISSSLNFGVLGPASMGEFVQSSIHTKEPVGWQNQIQNNIVIDYNIAIEKGLLSSPHFEFNVLAEAEAGTILNNLSAGIYTRTGSFIPVYRGVDFFNKKEKYNFQYWVFFSAKTNIVLYDATLQGGMFNSDNPYTIVSSDINRFVVNLSGGMAFYYNSLGIELHYNYLTPEFDTGLDFMWGSIVAVYNF